MKIKTTRRFIKDHANLPIVSAGYCSLQNLLYYHSPTAYTAGVYGWNFDVYELDGLTITTGYRGMIGPTAHHVEEYDQKAKGYLEASRIDGDEKREAVEALLKSFIEVNREEFLR